MLFVLMRPNASVQCFIEMRLILSKKLYFGCRESHITCISVFQKIKILCTSVGCRQ